MSSITGIKPMSVHNILEKDLKLKAYRPNISQKISDYNVANRLEFCQRMERMLEEGTLDLDKIILSDESHIYLVSVPKPQNDRKWAHSKPDFNFQKLLHSLKITVWVFGPFFFEDPVTGKAVTVTTAKTPC